MTTRTDDSESPPIESRDDLLATFAAGEKPRERWTIGTEHEKFVYRTSDHRAPSYEETGGIRDLLMGLTEFHGWEPGSRFSHYRFHLEAPVRFHKSIRATIEDGHANLRSDNLFSVGYWYQTEPHAAFASLPPAESRIPKIYPVGGPGQDLKMK